ncbi:hypothetical protein CVIRNUC_008865 [Coccomyxa viridis]|uniref:Uncharacterized protein n=1 Tax=Coccomyxa viridis TaxID=1274662 RepID=A0AAV1IE73_9CHLO|nr:hypothetical protein CVIRNUC_008865 [Coccomyxa viridis]
MQSANSSPNKSPQRSNPLHAVTPKHGAAATAPDDWRCGKPLITHFLPFARLPKQSGQGIVLAGASATRATETGLSSGGED